MNKWFTQSRYLAMARYPKPRHGEISKTSPWRDIQNLAMARYPKPRHGETFDLMIARLLLGRNHGFQFSLSHLNISHFVIPKKPFHLAGWSSEPALRSGCWLWSIHQVVLRRWRRERPGLLHVPDRTFPNLGVGQRLRECILMSKQRL